MLSPSLRRVGATAQSLLLQTLPHGGQRAARRNAWAAMSSDAATARARRDALAALELAFLSSAPVRSAR